MSYVRISLMSVALAAIVFATGATAWTTSPAGPPEPPPPAPPSNDREDAEARRLLHAAVAGLHPQRISWLQTNVVQSLRLPGLAYEAEGRYQLAPGRRFRLDMTTRIGSTVGRQRVVCDGDTLWQASGLADTPWKSVLRLDLDHAPAAGMPSFFDVYLTSQAFTGPHPLLHGLATMMVWPQREQVRRGTRLLHRLTGVWTDAARAVLGPKDQPWPTGLPCWCRLYLDCETLWPCRLEWWGKASEGADDRLLFLMELRDPVLNRPLPPSELATAFSFDPGPTPVQVLTAATPAPATPGVAAATTSHPR